MRADAALAPDSSSLVGGCLADRNSPSRWYRSDRRPGGRLDVKKRIIVCGYPKSGNTWLTRLTAEIVSCPVAGFWCEPFNTEESIEGAERESEYECFKAHHSADQMRQTFTHYANGTERIIYVVRDPRDVVVSASHYFDVRPRNKRVHGFASMFSGGAELYDRLFDNRRYRVDLFTEGLLRGTREGSWLRVPWREHVEGYLATDALVIRYEDLLDDPVAGARGICAHLDVERTDAELAQAVQAQSFDHRKKGFAEANESRRAQFLRRGEAGQWRQELSASNIQSIDEAIGEFMAELGYR